MNIKAYYTQTISHLLKKLKVTGWTIDKLYIIQNMVDTTQNNYWERPIKWGNLFWKLHLDHHEHYSRFQCCYTWANEITSLQTCTQFNQIATKKPCRCRHGNYPCSNHHKTDVVLREHEDSCTHENYPYPSQNKISSSPSWSWMLWPNSKLRFITKLGVVAGDCDQRQIKGYT